MPNAYPNARTKKGAQRETVFSIVLNLDLYSRITNGLIIDSYMYLRSSFSRYIKMQYNYGLLRTLLLKWFQYTEIISHNSTPIITRQGLIVPRRA